MDIPFKTYNKTDFPYLDDSSVGEAYGILYGKVSAIKLTCVNPNTSGYAIYKLPENTTSIGTAYVEVDDVFKTASIVSVDYQKGLLVISNGRSSASSAYQVKLVDCVGYVESGHSYPRQILQHFFKHYGGIEYTASNFDTATWESELDDASIQADIGFLLDDDGVDFWEVVYNISRNSKTYFRVDYNASGKIYAKRIDFTRASSLLIPSCDIKNINELKLESSRDGVFSSVLVKFSRNYFGDSWLSAKDSTYENDVKREYRKSEQIEEETYLVNAVDAQYRAYKHSTLFSVIPYTVELEIFGNYFIDLYDVLTISLMSDNLSAKSRQFAGNVDCIVIKTNPKESVQTNYITVQIISNRIPKDMQSFVMSGSYTTIEKDKSSLEIAKDDLNTKIDENISVNGYLSPASVTLSADKDGLVTDFTSAAGTFHLRYGSTEVNGNSTSFSISSKSEGIEATIDSSLGTYAVSEMTIDQGFIEFSGTYNGVAVKLTMTISKAIAGAETTVYGLQLSSKSVAVSSDGNTLTPANIVLNGTSKKGNELAIAYAGRFVIQETINGTDYDTVYTSAADESNYTYTPSIGIINSVIKLYLSGGTTTVLEQETITFIKDGQDGDATTFPADTDCIFYAPCDDVTKTNEEPEPTLSGIQSKLLKINCTGLSSYTMTELEAYNDVIILYGNIISDFVLTPYFNGSNGNGSKQYQIVNNLIPDIARSLTITTGVSGKTSVILPVSSLTLGSGCYIVIDDIGNVTHFAGEKGDTGNAATISVGTVTTLEPLQNVTIVNTGTQHAAVLDFGIPKGAKGDKGDQGNASVDGGYANSIYTSDQVIDGGSANNG